MKLNIRDLHIYYLAWRLSISGPQARRLAAAKKACGSGGRLAAAESPCGSWGLRYRSKSPGGSWEHHYNLLYLFNTFRSMLLSGQTSIL